MKTAGMLAEGRVVSVFEGEFENQGKKNTYTTYTIFVKGVSRLCSVISIKCYEERVPEVVEDTKALFFLTRLKPYKGKEGNVGLDYTGQFVSVIKEGVNFIEQMVSSVKNRK